MTKKHCKHQKRNIRNPEKWVGKYVRHMANWQDFQWPDCGNVYFVCEWTGELHRIEDEGHILYEEDLKRAEERGYDECYYYSQEAIDYFIAE